MPKKQPARYNPTHFCKLAELADFRRVPSGWAAIDIYTGGGIPIGTNILVSGPQASGKTALVSCIVTNYLAAFPESEVLYINFDNKLQAGPLRQRGADLARIEVMFPSTGEEAHVVIEDIARSRTSVGMVVIDSLAAMSPEREVIGEDQIAIAARDNNKLFRRMTALQLSRVRGQQPLTLIIINQTRVKTGLFPAVVLPGGNQQKFQAALWLSFQKADVHFDKPTGLPISQTFHYAFLKNEQMTGHYSAETRMATSPHGRWRAGEIIDHEFLWLWLNRLGLMKNRGMKGYEIDKIIQPKEAWLAAWQADRASYTTFVEVAAKGFVEWQTGRIEAPVLRSDVVVTPPESGEKGEDYAEVA